MVREEHAAVVAALWRLGGAAHREQLLRHVTWHPLRAATLSGEVRRVGRGTYTLPGTPPAGEAVREFRGVLSHQSAAAHWLLESLHPPTSVHVTVPVSSRRFGRKGVTLHYREVPAADDAGGATAPLRTVLECAADCRSSRPSPSRTPPSGATW